MKRSLFATAVLALAALRAGASVDAEVDAPAKVFGAFADASETDTLRIVAPRDATLTFSVKGRKKAQLAAALAVTGPDDTPLDLGTARRVTSKKGGLVVTGLPLPASGPYELALAGGGVGEYGATLRVTPRRVFTSTVTIPAAGTAQIPYAAPAGAVATVSVRAARGSAAQPRVAEGGGATKGAVRVTVGRTGDAAVFVANDGAEGDVEVTIKVRPPKAKTQKLDARPAALGGDDGAALAASTVPAEAGGSVAIAAPGSAVDGAGVAIPPGALDVDTRVVVSSAAQLDVPQPQANRSAGPAVRFGPEGLAFSTPATLTLPFDPSSLPDGVDPLEALDVLRVQEDGTTTVLQPSSVDVDAGLLTVPTSGFSVYQPFAPRGSPRLDGLSYWYASLELALEPDVTGQGDSRDRHATLEFGTLALGPQLQLGGASWSTQEAEFRWTHDGQGNGQVTPPQPQLQSGSGAWGYATDGRSIFVSDASDVSGAPVEFVVADDGSVLLRRPPPVAAGIEAHALSIALRRPATSPSLASLVGTWTIAYFGPDVFPAGPGPLFVARSAGFGTLTVRSDGTWQADVRESREFFDPAQGTLRTDGERARVNGTIAFEPSGDFPGTFVLVDTEPDSDGGVRLFPGAGGRMLLGGPADLHQGGGQMFVAVRGASGLARSQLVGDYESQGVFLPRLSTYAAGAGVVAGDVVLETVASIVTFDGGATAFRTVLLDVETERDIGTSAGIRNVEFTGGGSSVPITLASDGRFTAGGPGNIVGAFTRDLVFALVMPDPNGQEPPSGFELLVRPPPSR